MSVPNRLAVIAPLQPMSAGDVHPTGDLPLHLTLLPIVSVPGEATSRLLHDLAEAASGLAPILTTVRQEALFGPENDVAVLLVDPVPEATFAHELLLATAARSGALPIEPQYVRAGFRPHITKNGDAAAVLAGQRLRFDEVAIVEAPGGHVRVVSVVRLVGIPKSNGRLG